MATQLHHIARPTRIPDPVGKKYTREQAYDKLYRLACKVLEKQNACSKCPIFCKGATKDSVGFSKSWCCEGCPNLSKETGCTVEALMCRLHLCAPESRRQRKENPVLRGRQRWLWGLLQRVIMY